MPTRSTKRAAPYRPDPSRERESPPALFPTKNGLPEDVRAQVVPLLNQRLADCVDPQAQCKQAHWNVTGPSFLGLHELFDDIGKPRSVLRGREDVRGQRAATQPAIGGIAAALPAAMCVAV